MNLHAIYHKQKSNYAYAYSPSDLHIRVRTAKDDCLAIKLVISQKHNWKKKKKYQMKKIASDALFDYYQYEYISKDPRLGYYFEIDDGTNTIIYSESGFSNVFDDENSHFHYFQFPYINEVDVHKVPCWVKNRVFYQIFVERFYNGDKTNDPENIQEWGSLPQAQSFYGGDLQGIIDKLDYLTDLGINGLYLTPIFEAPSNHKYDTIDYRKIDPIFGDKDLFIKLVDLAHERDIKIVIDGVFNHSGWYFKPFVDVLERGEASPYKDWFFIDSLPLERYTVEEVLDFTKELDLSKLNYRAFGINPNMPKLNTENPELRRYLLDTVTYWMKEANIDGWRLDVSDEVSHDFWREFRKRVKTINKEALIVGENWHDAYQWLQGDQFDGVMNYSVTKSLIQFFPMREIDGKAFASDLTTYLFRNSRQAQDAMLNLLDSHDTVRFLSWCNKDTRLVKMATLILFSYVGMPCVYYGSEIGMEGGGDPDCRRTFDWDQRNWDLDLWNFYKNIIEIRKSKKPLIYGDIKIASKDYIVYLSRTYEGEVILTLVNNTKEPKYVDFSLGHGTSLSPDKAYKPLIETEEGVGFSLLQEGKLPAFSGCILAGNSIDVFHIFPG